MEREVHEFVQSVLPDVLIETSTRRVIAPKELDIYVPSKSIAIEFNGLYWHSEKVLQSVRPNSVASEHHHNKWKLCADKGIQLITVWEDDWRERPEAVKSMLAHKLGVSAERKVMARKTEFVTVPNTQAQVFLDTHHIQGYRAMTRNYGLQDKATSELIAVMSFSVNKETASLDRYATSCIVSGGFTKLLKAAITELPESVTRVITFSDNEVSDGNLYASNGFTVDAVLEPDYKYIYEGSRHHKFLFRKKRFKEDPALMFDEGMTERELAELNEVERIWDAGKTRWALALV